MPLHRGRVARQQMRERLDDAVVAERILRLWVLDAPHPRGVGGGRLLIDGAGQQRCDELGRLAADGRERTQRRTRREPTRVPGALGDAPEHPEAAASLRVGAPPLVRIVRLLGRRGWCGARHYFQEVSFGRGPRERRLARLSAPLERLYLPDGPVLV
eukprot:4185290-Prymnesium_polylepis.1